MKKKYQIFISSTFRDLVVERQEAIRSVLDMDHIPAGMEIFPAADVEQFEYIKKVIDECDYYILIIGARYGSIDDLGVSFTEKEYDYAVTTGKVVLVFIHGSPENIPVAKVDIDPVLATKLEAFRERASSGRLVQKWTSHDELKFKIVISLTKAINEMPQVGWIRGNAVASEDLLAQINGLRNENDELRSAYAKLEAKTKPKLEGLAKLSDLYKVRYTYTYRVHSNLKHSSDDEQLKWEEIFVAVGPELIRPHAPSIISTAIVKYLKENKDINRTSMSVYDTDENVIKIHLVALGLIASQSANKVGGGVGEFIQLTELGRSKLLELMAVTSPAPIAPKK
jgi:hypothetical protein